MTGQVPEDTRSHAQQWVQFSRTCAVMGWIPKDTRSHAQSRMAVSLVLEDVGSHPRVWARSPRTGAVTHRFSRTGAPAAARVVGQPPRARIKPSGLVIGKARV